MVDFRTSKRSPSIESLSSTVQDNGRRGEPRAGCDCMQCFGYCMVDADQAVRQRALANDHRPMGVGGLPAEVDKVFA